jgi:hypothetical protein
VKSNSNPAAGKERENISEWSRCQADKLQAILKKTGAWHCDWIHLSIFFSQEKALTDAAFHPEDFEMLIDHSQFTSPQPGNAVQTVFPNHSHAEHPLSITFQNSWSFIKDGVPLRTIFLHGDCKQMLLLVGC